MWRALGLALAACLFLPALATGHVYGPRADTTIAAVGQAIAITGLECEHVSVVRGELPKRKVAGQWIEVQGRARSCEHGGRVTLDDDVRGRAQICRVAAHELHHVDGWRARSGEAYIDGRGRRFTFHHRSKRSIMHPRPAVPAGCR